MASTDDIKKLREQTSAGVLDIKEALDQAKGDVDAALKILKERGASIAAKKASRATGQGLIETYTHMGRVGAMVEVNCETDFVARNTEFKELAHELVLQVAS
ncbi:MAG TPA: elongation factor Ts, partial [Patescibacteria group bacterium]|nr:elongation factor Ts [Patescibacteria group bacterium]